MKKRFIILFILILFACIFLLLWWKQTIQAPSNNEASIVTFNIQRGESIKTIADRLHREGLIRSSVAFFLLARFGGLDNNIQAGEFRLSPSMDLPTIASRLTHGTLDVQITIPEGWRNEEIAIILTKQFAIPETEFLKVAKEGYMFPDTYQLPKDITASRAADLFLANFNKKVTQDIKNKAKQRGLTVDELVTVASLVEREARFPEDRPLVASIILNRYKQNMALDIDATIQYILGYQADEKTWWKKDLTQDDLAIVSPYNTYQNPGLPPTPIANPGLAAIQAVVNAPETDYLFYVSDKQGHIHPAKTAEEHQANIEKYVNR